MNHVFPTAFLSVDDVPELQWVALIVFVPVSVRVEPRTHLNEGVCTAGSLLSAYVSLFSV